MGYNGVFISVVFVQMESVPETNIIETFYVANNLLILIMGIFFNVYAGKSSCNKWYYTCNVMIQ